MATPTEILHRDDLPLGGFAGLREHRLVTDSKAWGTHRAPGAWDGLGHFVYLADARFVPHGETRLHPHREIDVISVMVEGCIAHEGSLGDGEQLNAYDVQVQRAGGEGFTHNEVNPDDVGNRMIQLWSLPETSGQPAGYKTYSPAWGALTRVYGGPADQQDTFAGQTVIEVGLLHAGDTAAAAGDFIAYLTKGSGAASGTAVADGDLLRGSDLQFTADEDTQLIVIRLL